MHSYAIDCQVFKYPRSNHDDKMPEIPNTINICKLKDQQVFDVEGTNIKIIHTPGHTTDHVILASPTGVIFSGDCILGNIRPCILYFCLKTSK